MIQETNVKMDGHVKQINLILEENKKLSCRDNKILIRKKNVAQQRK